MWKGYFKSGTWNAVCAVCGFEYKADQLKERWDGVKVCEADWEPRHILDFFKPRAESGQTVPWSQDVIDDIGDTYLAVTNADSPVTLTDETRVVMIDASDGNITINLPLANTYDAAGTGIEFSRTDTESNTVTIQRQGSDLVSEGTSITLQGQNKIRLINDKVSRWSLF